MLKNYFITALRSILKNRVSGFINIFSLSLGLTVAVVIGLWIEDEISFDKSFEKHAQLAEVMLNQESDGNVFTGPTIATPVAEPLRTQFPDDILATALISFNDEHIIMAGDRKISKFGRWVQPDFTEMFTLTMIEGTRPALHDPGVMMLSRSASLALFGSTGVLDRVVRIDNRFDLKVGGVYEDLPENVSLDNMDFLMPWDSRENWLNTITDWDNHSAYMFIQLAPGADIVKLTERVRRLPSAHITEYKEEIMLYPFDRLHLYGDFVNGKPAGGRINFVWLIMVIGGFVLLLACINFMNLSTARSEKRAKEVGIRKTIGSHRGQLIRQFLTESILTAFFSMIISLGITFFALPFFNFLAGKSMHIPWNDPVFWFSIIGFVIIAGVIAGSYPAFYLSSFKPVKVLKGTFKSGPYAALPRKVLVVVQFTVSLVLVIGTIVIFRQIQFAKDRPAGYARSGLITIPIKTPDLQGHYDAIRRDLLNTGFVENMAESSLTITSFNNNNSVDWAGRDKNTENTFRDIFITPDFGNTVGWKIVRGRDFSRDVVSDSGAVLLNETAVRVTKFAEPVGETVTYFGKTYRVIGVVADMVTRSPYDRIEPAIFLMGKWLSVITIRINPGQSAQKALAGIQQVITKYNPNAPFEYRFTDDEYGKKFREEERTGNLAAVFAVLTIVISSLGIFGLASYLAEQRTKEIGIRKVLGASVSGLWALLSRDFIFLVCISCTVAVPFAWIVFRGWLQHFTYRSPLAWWIFAASGAGALVITLVTVSVQAIKAANANPVKSLRTE